MPDRIKSVRNSVFVRGFNNNKEICIVSLFAAALCLIITYPGNLFSDVYERIELARNIKDLVRDLIHGTQGEPYQIWVTPTPAYFLAFFRIFLGNYSGYAFFQAFFFFYFSLLLIKRLTVKNRFMAYILYLFNPVFFSVSIYYDVSIGYVTGFVALVFLLELDFSTLMNFDRAAVCVLTVFTSFIVFGFRANAFTILPVAAAFIIYNQKAVLSRVLLIAMLFLGVFFVAAIPKILNIDTMSPSTGGFFWKTVTTIARMPPEKQEKYITYYDDLYGEGKTKVLVDAMNREEEFFPSIHVLFKEFDDYGRADLSKAGLKANLEKYINLFREEPYEALRTEVFFITYSLGIGNHLFLGEWYYDMWDQGSRYGLTGSRVRHWFLDSYSFAVNKTYFPLRPYLMLIITLIVVITKIKVEKIKYTQSLEFWLVIFSVFYYAGIVVSTHSMEFRYFYPAFYSMLVADICCLAGFIARFRERKAVKASE